MDNVLSILLSLVSAKERLICVWSKVFWNDKLITIHYLFVIVVVVVDVECALADRGICVWCMVYGVCLWVCKTKTIMIPSWFTFNRETALQLCGLYVPRVFRLRSKERESQSHQTVDGCMETDQPYKLLLLRECIHFPLNLDSTPYLCS